mgnify:CR=1 FL=1
MKAVCIQYLIIWKIVIITARGSEPFDDKEVIILKTCEYFQKHDLNGDDYNLSFVFPGFSEKSDYNHSSLTIIILFIALIFIILVIICYILLDLLLFLL